MLLFSPLWLFFVPGSLLTVAGLGGVAVLFAGPVHLGAIELDIHSMLVFAMMAQVGAEILTFAAFTKNLAIQAKLHPREPMFDWLSKWLGVEIGTLLGLGIAFGGVALLGSLFFEWEAAGFGHLSPQATMRRAIPSVLMMGVGLHVIFASWLFGVLGVLKKVPLEPAVSTFQEGRRR